MVPRENRRLVGKASTDACLGGLMFVYRRIQASKDTCMGWNRMTSLDDSIFKDDPIGRQFVHRGGLHPGTGNIGLQSIAAQGVDHPYKDVLGRLRSDLFKIYQWSRDVGRRQLDRSGTRNGELDDVTVLSDEFTEIKTC